MSWFAKLGKFCQFQFSRSSGKGGQNVNKRDTKVLMNFNASDALTSGSLPLDVYNNIRLPPNKMLQITCQNERSQHANIREVKSRFESILTRAELDSVPKTTSPETTTRIIKFQKAFRNEQKINKSVNKIKKAFRKRIKF